MSQQIIYYLVEGGAVKMSIWSKYQCEGQMTIFDFINEPETPSVAESNQSIIRKIEEREILKGSGFENGKTRIYNFFKEDHTEKECAEFLKKEYGQGGWSIDEGWCDHNANGIDIKFNDLIGKCSEVHIGWPMVAKRIKELINTGKYRPNEEKICKLSNHTCNKNELWKIADTFDDVICPHVCCNKCSEKLCGARCNGAEAPKENYDPKTEKPLCSKSDKCEAYPIGCGGTIEPCRFGGPYNWSNKPEEPREDVHIDREGREHVPAKWMKYERCENCSRWQRYVLNEQPPAGWGVMGYCMEHKNKNSSCSYCNSFDDKRAKEQK